MEDEQISNHGSKENGLKSATLFELKEKVNSEMEEKQAALEVEVLKKHRVTAKRFQYSVEYYTTGSTEVLKNNGVDDDEVDEHISD